MRSLSASIRQRPLSPDRRESRSDCAPGLRSGRSRACRATGLRRRRPPPGAIAPPLRRRAPGRIDTADVLARPPPALPGFVPPAARRPLTCRLASARRRVGPRPAPSGCGGTSSAGVLDVRQRGQARDRHRRTGARSAGRACGRSPRSKASSSRLEALRRQILVGVLRDLDHRRVHAGAQALDLLPGERAVGGTVMRLVVDAVAADLDQLARPAQHAGRRAADLDMRVRADRLQVEHRVEGRDLEHADQRHVEHVRDALDGRLGDPALLLLRPPEQRDHRGGLPARRKLGDLPLRPGTVFGREGKALRAGARQGGGRP